MHGLILAGGEGARLAAGGIVVPKPLVEVAGKPQLLRLLETLDALGCDSLTCAIRADLAAVAPLLDARRFRAPLDRKSTRLNSSHGYISYAVFCLKKKKERRSNAVKPHISDEPTDVALAR